MKVWQLLDALVRYDGDTEVLVPGYERDWDVLDVVLCERAERVRPDDDDSWYHGTHVTLGEGAPHVLLASKRRPEFARGSGR